MKKIAGLAALATLATGMIGASVPSNARAFCGFYVGGAETSLYNDATMVVLMRDGTRTVLSMQNSYQGPPENFAMVVPVPVVLQQENVRTLPASVFQSVDRLAAPRLVEYWEQDPCAPMRHARPTRSRRGRMAAPPAQADGPAGGLGVTIEAQFEVGEYDIVILSAQDSGGLDTWLRQEGYHIPAGAEPALRPYVQQGTKFFVARVDVSRVTFQNNRAVLSPLRVHYDSDTFSLPVRLGLINSRGTQDLMVHILGRNQRFEVANYPNAFIPTNISVRPAAVRNFGAFYAALFDKTLEMNPGAVVTEYAWQAGSCDPCPGPVLSSSDLMTLGADVVGTGGGGGAIVGRGRGRGRGGWGLAQQWTLTRLHYRYSAGALDEDLVFRAAPAAVGGRGQPNRAGRFDSTVSTSAGVNNFQGRYARLHWWRGPITCENPRRGQWGGPPNGQNPGTRAATNLGSVQRRRTPLEAYVRRPIRELQRRRRRRPRGGGGPGTPFVLGPHASLIVGPELDDSDPLEPAFASATIMGCSISRHSYNTLPIFGVALVGLAFIVRRFTVRRFTVRRFTVRRFTVRRAVRRAVRRGR